MAWLGSYALVEAMNAMTVSNGFTKETCSLKDLRMRLECLLSRHSDRESGPNGLLIQNKASTCFTSGGEMAIERDSWRHLVFRVKPAKSCWRVKHTTTIAPIEEGVHGIFYSFQSQKLYQSTCY